MKLLFENWRSYTESLLNEDLLIESYEDAKKSVIARASKWLKGYVYEHDLKAYNKIEEEIKKQIFNEYALDYNKQTIEQIKNEGYVYHWDAGGNYIRYMLTEHIIPYDITDKQKQISLLWVYKQFIGGNILNNDEKDDFVFTLLAVLFIKVKKSLKSEELLDRNRLHTLYDSKYTFFLSLIKQFKIYNRQQRKYLLENFFHWNQFIRDGKRDLNSVSDFNELEELVKQAEPLYYAWQNKQDQKDAESGKEFLLNNEDWLIYAIHNKGAAREFGRNSNLCTAAPGLDYFEQYYREDDPLFAIIDLQNNEKFQFSFGGDDFAYLRPPNEDEGECGFKQVRASKKQLDKIMPVLQQVIPQKYQTARQYIKDYMSYLETNQNKTIQESVGARLKDYATIKTNFKDADFWIIRRGTAEKVGKPTKEYNPEHIGIKVTATDKLLPSYLYYAMEYIWSKGIYKQIATGTLKLVNIKTEDIKNIPIG